MIVREIEAIRTLPKAPIETSRRRPVSRRRLRVHGLLMVAGFFLLVTGLDRGLSLLLDTVFQRVEVGVFGGIVNHARQARADVVVLGSSRAWHHYDTAILRDRLGTTVYNAGCDGQGLPYMRGVMDLILQDYRPALFIIDVDAHLVRPSNPYLDRAVVLAPFMDESEVIRELIYSRGPFEWMKYLSRLFRYNSRALAILRDAGRPNHSDAGFEPVDEVMFAASELPDAPPTWAHLPPEPRDLELLREMIQVARAAGSRVLLVRSPRYHRDETGASADSLLLAGIRRVAEEEQVPYLVISSENTPKLRDTLLFVDPGHLNRRGARIFTAALTDRLDRMGLREALLGVESAVAHARPR